LPRAGDIFVAVVRFIAVVICLTLGGCAQTRLLVLTDPIAFNMERKMLQGIKARADAAASN